MKNLTSANVSEFSTKELVAFYNANAEHFGKKQITKFADRSTAELRVRMMAADLDLARIEKAKIRAKEDTTLQDAFAEHGLAPETKDWLAKKASETRSKGISESWNDPEVAAKRAQRHNVKVGKDVYRSVLEAFKKLHLPVSQHIKFRMALKAAKTAEFKLGDQVFKFSLVEQENLPL